MHKIVFIINTLNLGGAEKSLINLIHSLPQAKYQSTILLLQKGKNSLSGGVKNVRQIFRLLPNSLRFFICSHFPRQIAKKIQKKFNPDLLVAYTEGLPSFLLYNSKDTFNEKRCKFIHCRPDVQRKSLDRFYGDDEKIKNFFDDTDSVFISEQLAHEYINCFGINPDRIHVINNITISNNIASTNDTSNNSMPRDCVRLLYVGRLEKIKSVDRLIVALSESKINFHLDIVGAGSQEQHIKQIVIDKKLQSKVTFNGFSTDLSSFYNNADYLVIPSISEGFPMVIEEAACCGLPFISTNCSADIVEFSRHYGIGIIAENSVDGLINALSNCLAFKDDTAKKANEYKRIVEEKNKKSLSKLIEYFDSKISN